MKANDYVAFAAHSIRLTAAANRIFKCEVVGLNYDLRSAFVDGITFHADRCCVGYSHCGRSDCGERGEVNIPIEKLLAVADNMQD